MPGLSIGDIQGHLAMMEQEMDVNVMTYFNDSSREISYTPSKWCFDLLCLRNENELTTGSLTVVHYSDIFASQSRLSTSRDLSFDRVFAISTDVLIAVNFDEHLIMTYRYSQPRYLYSRYVGKSAEKWLDVICVASHNRYLGGNCSYSLFILTVKGRIVILELDSANRFVPTYDVIIDSKRCYTKILPCNLCESDNSDPLFVYLWAPKPRILQKFKVDLQIKVPSDTEKRLAEPVPHTELKIKNPKLNGQEISIEGSDLTLAIDYQNNSVICADSKKHILFENSMTVSRSEVICGCGMPGTTEENTASKAAFLSAPCAPLVFRPQDYVEKGRFTTASKNVLGATERGRPRLLLVCDVNNQAVRKIWQFPNTPQALDLNSFDRIYTLIGEFHYTDRYQPRLYRRCENPKALYVNPYGLLTITAGNCAYIIAAYNVIPEQKTIQSNISADT